MVLLSEAAKLCVADYCAPKENGPANPVSSLTVIQRGTKLKTDDDLISAHWRKEP